MSIRLDDFVKSPSVPLRAGLRFNSFSPVPEGLAPQEPYSSVFTRLASGAFYEVILSLTFYEFIGLERFEKESEKALLPFYSGGGSRLKELLRDFYLPIPRPIPFPPPPPGPPPPGNVLPPPGENPPLSPPPRNMPPAAPGPPPPGNVLSLP